MAGGAACAVSCRSGILAKSSCSATPMARARTTIFPSLAPAETNNRGQTGERGQSDMGAAQRGQRGKREVISGPDRKHKRDNPPTPPPPPHPPSSNYSPGKDIQTDS